MKHGYEKSSFNYERIILFRVAQFSNGNFINPQQVIPRPARYRFMHTMRVADPGEIPVPTASCYASYVISEVEKECASRPEYPSSRGLKRFNAAK